MQEPHDHRIGDLGDEVQLSIDLLFMVKSRITYEWWFKEQKIVKSDKRFKDSNTGTLKIECFENKYRGAYKCVLSTTHGPEISISADVELNFQSE